MPVINNWIIPDNEKIIEWWERLKGSKGIWSKLEGNSFESFRESVRNSHLVFDFGFGFGRVTNLTIGLSARVHGVFWSPDIFRCPELVLVALSWLSFECRLQRIECVVPEKMRGLRRFLEKSLFFELEGTMKSFYSIDGKKENACLYSLTGEKGGMNG